MNMSQARRSTRVTAAPVRHQPEQRTESSPLVDNEEYDVLKIEDIKLVKGRALYKVSWTDFPTKDWLSYDQFASKKLVTETQRNFNASIKLHAVRLQEEKKIIAKIFNQIIKQINKHTRGAYAHHSIRSFKNCMYSRDWRRVTVACDWGRFKGFAVPKHYAKKHANGYDFESGSEAMMWLNDHLACKRNEMGQVIEPRVDMPFQSVGYKAWGIAAGGQLADAVDGGGVALVAAAADTAVDLAGHSRVYVITRLPDTAEGGETVKRYKIMNGGRLQVHKVKKENTDQLKIDSYIKVRCNSETSMLSMEFVVVCMSGDDNDYASVDEAEPDDTKMRASRRMEFGSSTAPPADVLLKGPCELCLAELDTQAALHVHCPHPGHRTFRNCKVNMFAAVTGDLARKLTDLEIDLSNFGSGQAAIDWKAACGEFRKTLAQYEFDTWFKRSLPEICLTFRDDTWVSEAATDENAREIWGMWKKKLHAVFRMKCTIMEDVQRLATKCGKKFPKVGGPSTMFEKASPRRSAALHANPPSPGLSPVKQRAQPRKRKTASAADLQKDLDILEENRKEWKQLTEVYEQIVDGEISTMQVTYWHNTRTEQEMDTKPACMRWSDEDIAARRLHAVQEGKRHRGMQATLDAPPTPVPVASLPRPQQKR